MRVLPVKIYNQTIATKKYNNPNKACNPRSMFFFTRSDRKGYPTTDRQKGYVAFDDCRATFGINSQLAIHNFKRT